MTAAPPAVDKRQRRGCSDFRHEETDVIAVFFSLSLDSIQFNSFLMQREKYGNYNANEADD